MVSNPNQYSKSATSPTAQIEDGVDFPHTGIIKALSDGLGQNYAISGFDITIDSATQIDVGAGVIFRDGNKVSISAVNNMSLSSTYTNGYHLLVADSSNVLRIRNPTAVNKVPEYTAGDTIIAVVTHNGTANVGLQYLTVNKTENSLSIGYNDSGYTEMSKITAASGGTTVEVPTAGGDFIIDNTDADKKIVARLGSDDANTAFEVRNDSDAAKLSVDATGATTITGTTDNDIALTVVNSKNASNSETATLRLKSTQGTDSDFEVIHDAFGHTTFTSNQPDSNTNAHIKMTNDPKVQINPNAMDMDFQVAGDTQTNLIYADASTDRVGVGTDTPLSDLHVSNASGATLTLESTDTTIAADELIGGIDFLPNDASEDGNEVSAFIRARSHDASPDSYIQFGTLANAGSVDDSVAERMRIDKDGKVGIGVTAPDNLLEVQNSDDTTNAVVFPFKLSQITSGTPANGLGVGMQFEVETSAGNNEIGATMEVVTTDVSSGSEDFKIVFKAMAAGSAAAEMLSLDANNITTPTNGRVIVPGFGYNFGGAVYVSGPTSSKGNISFARVVILDVRNTANNFFALPSAAGVSNGQLITLKNPTSASAIISPQSGDEIDFGSTNNAMVTSANVITLTSASCITLMAYSGWDKNNLTDSNGLGATQSGWFVVNQTV